MIKRTTKKTKVEAVEPEIIPNRDRRMRIQPITIVAILIVLAVIAFGIKAVWISPTNTSNQLQVRNGVDPQAVEQVIKRVGQLVATSESEVPTIATIQDIDQLRPQNPTLYRDAANGDKLLVWSDKIVVYSTSKDRVLVVMPIQVTAPAVAPGADATTTSSTATPVEEKATVQVLNGTPTSGLARTMNDKLKAAGITTIAASDAQQKNYAATVIYNASGKSLPKTLEKLVSLTGGTVVDTLPGEAAAKSDIVVIMGTK